MSRYALKDQTVALPLFAQPNEQPIGPYRRNSATSLNAAVKVSRGDGIKAIHMLILSAIRKRGPLTPECGPGEGSPRWL